MPRTPRCWSACVTRSACRPTGGPIRRTAANCRACAARDVVMTGFGHPCLILAALVGTACAGAQVIPPLEGTTADEASDAEAQAAPESRADASSPGGGGDAGAGPDARTADGALGAPADAV